MVWESSICLSHWILSRRIDCYNKTILELGSGTGLPSILAIIYGGAHKVVCTDYPDEKIIDVMKKNVNLNIKSKVFKEKISVHGYKWGDEIDTLIKDIDNDG